MAREVSYIETDQMSPPIPAIGAAGFGEQMDDYKNLAGLLANALRIVNDDMQTYTTAEVARVISIALAFADSRGI